MTPTVSQCPYCNSSKSQFFYRFSDVGFEGVPNADLLRVIEIYCGHCKRAISITPLLQPAAPKSR